MSPTEYQEKPANSGWRGGKQLDAEPRARYRGFRRIALALHLDLMGGVKCTSRTPGQEGHRGEHLHVYPMNC